MKNVGIQNVPSIVWKSRKMLVLYNNKNATNIYLYMYWIKKYRRYQWFSIVIRCWNIDEYHNKWNGIVGALVFFQFNQSNGEKTIICMFVFVIAYTYIAEEERPGTEHRQSNCKMDLVYVFLSYRPFSIQCIAWAPFVSSAIFIVISSNGIDLTLFANSSSHIQFHNIRFPFCLVQRSTLNYAVLYTYMYISLSMTTKNMFIAFIYRMPFWIFSGTQIFVCSLWMFTWRCVLLRCYSVGPMLQYTPPSSSKTLMLANIKNLFTQPRLFVCNFHTLHTDIN